MDLLYLPRAVFEHLRVAKLRKKGVKTNRRIVVFESDDWGSIRMPSIEVRRKLVKKNIPLVSPNSYDRYDTLASDSDLTALMEVLSKVKDKNGCPAIITLDTVVANPDFNRISNSDYKKYYYEPFTETLKRYPNHSSAFLYWKQGIEGGLFRPQFHGREHLNALRWLRCLQAGDSSSLEGFKYGMYSVLSTVDGKQQRVLETYNVDYAEDYLFIKIAIKEGLDLFERIFGFRSESMIAPCYTWDYQVEEAAFNNGVHYMQGGVFQKHSIYYAREHTPRVSHSMGQISSSGQLYMVRNCFFEPTENPCYDANRCLKDIERAFSYNLPAVVSCHRQNFIGGLDVNNRDNNLRQFKSLLQTVVSRWPDVEFLSSDQLGKFLKTYYE